MIKEIIYKERLFQILFENVNFYNENVKFILMNYINKYIDFKSASSEDFKNHYENFLKQYSKDSKKFINSNTYPALSNDNIYEISREEYDVFLLLSTIFTQHRYDITTSIYNILKPLDSALVIGSGVGIELELIKSSYKSISAYDIKIDDFCNSTHKHIDFYEEEFFGSNDKYNDVYIIELLEHIHNPYELIKNAKNSIHASGRIIITLAINIPQFDHVFNFDDLSDFRKEIDSLDLLIASEKEINHNYIMNGLNTSRNIFMVLKAR